MDNIISNQAYLFLLYFICGIIIGIFFDIFRILRKSFKTPDFITYLEDIIFGIVTGIFLIFVIYVYNNGSLRFYMFLAIILGIIIYLSTISKIFIKISVKILVTIKKIIIYPIKKLFRPFFILTINIKNLLKLKLKRNKKSKKTTKKELKFNNFLNFKKIKNKRRNLK